MQPTLSLRILWSLCFSSLFFLTVFSQRNDGIIALSFNIRYDNPKDAPNDWTQRKDKVAQLIHFHQADLIGMQEALKHQLEELQSFLPTYNWVGVGRDDGKDQGEFSPIFYHKKRFKLLDSNTFWLSETCDEPGSRGWDAACNRIVSWVQLKDRKNKHNFYVFNTHFDHQGEIARKESAQLVIEKIQSIAGKSDFVLLGDFNSRPDQTPYQILAQAYEDSYNLSQHGHYGPETTFTGFSLLENDDGNRIDHIFVPKGTQILRHATLTDSWGGGAYPSDHFPVLAEIKW